jgi:TetR/AcrR family transcriptional regulator, copper-responsive repressor
MYTTHPLGCMVILNTVMARLEENQHVTESLNAYRVKMHQGFIHCIQRGVDAGKLISPIDSNGLATIFDSFLIGVSSLAREDIDKQHIEFGISKLLTLLN